MESIQTIDSKQEDRQHCTEDTSVVRGRQRLSGYINKNVTEMRVKRRETDLFSHEKSRHTGLIETTC
jgi:hypothetical protein